MRRARPSWSGPAIGGSLGRLEEAIELARRLHAAALEIGDQQAVGIALAIWARAAAGRVPQELIQQELSRHSDDARTLSEVLQAEGVRLLGEGDARAAATRFGEAWDIVQRAGAGNMYIHTIPNWHATALRRAALSTSAGPCRESLLRQARRVARRGLSASRIYRSYRPHALRETALLALLRGHVSRARVAFAESLAIAQAQEARYEIIQTQLAQSEAELSLPSSGAS